MGQEQQGLGALTGSRASMEPASGLHPSGFDPEREREVFPIGGYAPGDYMGRCHKCGGEFIGAKRSFQCLDCAVVTLKAAFIGLDRALRIKLWNEAKGRGSSDRAAMEYVAKERDAAIAIEAATAGETCNRLGPKGESAGLKGIAQKKPGDRPPTFPNTASQKDSPDV